MNDDDNEVLEIISEQSKKKVIGDVNDSIIRNIAFYDEENANSIIREQFEIFANEDENLENRVSALNTITEISSIRKNFPYEVFYELFIFYSPTIDRNLVNDSIIKILEFNDSIANKFMQEASLVYDLINQFSNIVPDFLINVLKALLNKNESCDQFISYGLVDILHDYIENHKEFYNLYNDQHKSLISSHILTILELYSIIINKMEKDISIIPQMLMDIAQFIQPTYEYESPAVFYKSISTITSIISNIDKRKVFKDELSPPIMIETAQNILEIFNQENALFILQFFSALSSSKVFIDDFSSSNVPLFLLQNIDKIEKSNEIYECFCSIITNVLRVNEELYPQIIESGVITSFTSLLEFGSPHQKFVAANFFTLICEEPFFSQSETIFKESQLIVQLGDYLMSCDKENNDVRPLIHGLYQLIQNLKFMNMFHPNDPLGSQFSDSCYKDLIEDSCDNENEEELDNPSQSNISKEMELIKQDIESYLILPLEA